MTSLVGAVVASWERGTMDVIDMILTHSIYRDRSLFPMCSGVSERASERMSAAERASEASSAEQANE